MSTAPEKARPSQRRTDIQVLRALAVGGVVINHLFPNRLTGGYLGVDVFFVISGFLITSHLAAELRATGRVRLARFWARRARRLLPASLLVLAVTLVATWVWLPEAAWQQVSREVLGSALYVQNWVLAASEQDYFRSSQSPVAGDPLLVALGRGAVLPRVAGPAAPPLARCPVRPSRGAARGPRGRDGAGAASRPSPGRPGR